MLSHDRVARFQLHFFLRERLLQIVRRDDVAALQHVHILSARHVDQHAARHDVRNFLDAQFWEALSPPAVKSLLPPSRNSCHDS